MTENRQTDAGPKETAHRAAEYVRMSTDHQKYSTQNQQDAIRTYAAARGIQIVRTYADEGKSGLSMARRDALKKLIDDVETGNADFRKILVYDISRWGRFQDTDESAYYEYVCKRAGIGVQYCAEPFDNDGSPFATVVKIIKRAMAAEYSRELSAKVFAGAARLAQLGYKQGGSAGYGLRRLLIDDRGTAKGELTGGQHKNLVSDRVILIPGPREEVETVRWMYESISEGKHRPSEIAAILNAKGIKSDLRRLWNGETVRQVLTNEKYVGNYVWNKRPAKFRKKRRPNSPDMWIRAENVIERIVDRPLFDAVQVRLRVASSPRFSEQEMLIGLRRLLEARGHLSWTIINQERFLPCAQTYRNRFGSLAQAYKIVGFEGFEQRRGPKIKFHHSRPGQLASSDGLRRYLAMG